MDIPAKELRYRTKQILQSLSRGARLTITYRGRPVARLLPISSRRAKNFRPIGFGMWRDHDSMKDVAKWLDAQRKLRYGRS